MKIAVIVLVSLFAGIVLSSGYWWYKSKITGVVNDINILSLKADLHLKQLENFKTVDDPNKLITKINFDIQFMSTFIKVFEKMPFKGKGYEFFIESRKEKLDLLINTLEIKESENT